MEQLKVDTTEFGKLRDQDIEVKTSPRFAHEKEASCVTVTHKSTGIIVTADSQNSLQKNWEIAQRALNAALEHQEAVGRGQPERKGHL